eukprot:6184113-Pleurochrysis_carterae.AAC.2
MKRRAAARDGQGAQLPPSTMTTIVQMALKDVDHGKTDNTNATLIVVEQVGETTYHVANRAEYTRSMRLVLT